MVIRHSYPLTGSAIRTLINLAINFPMVTMDEVADVDKVTDVDVAEAQVPFS